MENNYSLRSITWKRFLRAPDVQLMEELYIPALSCAERYDRCCAYFSSRVLAVAARGFGGFIQNLLAMGDTAPKPSARLLVNEQLDPNDISALTTTGDQSKLIKKLLKQFKSPTDALEKNRLEMLAWLVASGLLEVRVGLMRYTQGIAHAKFGIVTDSYGDFISFMGSDNETGNALLDNYEELEVRSSWNDEEFADYYQERFNTLWEDHDPHVTTLPLPDAVKNKLIKIAPIKPPQEMKPDRKTLETAMLWHFLAAASYLSNGEYACDATAMVDMWPHQRRVVEDTARAFPAGRLLCDEVGMGKTLEAILVLRRLLCGRGVRRALLLVPAGLLPQWQDELREKGGLLVPRWESGTLYLPNGDKHKTEAVDVLAKHPILLMSREWARLDNNRALILTAPAWDIVLLDEAHAARRSTTEEGGFNSANLLLQTLRELQLRQRTRGILLLSATPMQTQPWEPWDLLSVLGVGSAWMADFSSIRAFYDGIASLHSNALFLPAARTIARLVADDPCFPPPPISTQTGDADTLAKALSFALPDKQKKYVEWLRHGSPLGRYMHRNTRDTLRAYHRKGLLALPPALRKVKDELFDYDDPGERDIYDAVAKYINDRFDQLEHQKPGKGFVMTIYRRRAASSPAALRRSLERRIEGLNRVIKRQHLDNWLTADELDFDTRDLEDDADQQIDPALPTNPKEAETEKRQVDALLQRLYVLEPTDSKLAKFMEVLQEITSDGRAALVFTEYTDTMHYLRDRLRPLYGETLGCYSGAGGQVWDGHGWQTTTKADITRRLTASDLKVLLCTDAASEGLNLQAASALIQYDLPWNPSKCEQRIGRIDRIGQQQQELPVRNLFLKDSVDMLVYKALQKRCGLFEHFVGRMQPVLALARDALKGNLKREEAAAFVLKLDNLAETIKSDQVISSAYASSDAEDLPNVITPATRADFTEALGRLSQLTGSVGATQIKGQLRWRLRGVEKRAVEVTTDRESLEQHKDVLPMTAGAAILLRLAEKMPLPASRVPLVLGEYSCDGFRCVEARWIQAGNTIPVTSATHLKHLLDAWDGRSAPPSLAVKVHDEARAAAKKRVTALMERASKEQEASLERQAIASRIRLMRELARTLRCIGPGNLNALFQEQANREKQPNGRYHRALALLGGYPTWTQDDITDATLYVNGIGTKERQSRVNLGSELEAAIADPRWRAVKDKP